MQVNLLIQPGKCKKNVSGNGQRNCKHSKMGENVILEEIKAAYFGWSLKSKGSEARNEGKGQLIQSFCCPC